VNIGVEEEINKVILKKAILISQELLHIKAVEEENKDGEEIQKEEKVEEVEKVILKILIQKLKKHL
jgi:hypothetical protein